MAEWLFEDGFGGARAALVEDATVVEALIDPDTPRLRAGSIVEGRFTKADGAGIVTVGAHEARIARPLPDWTEGATVRIAIVREALPERGAIKRAVGVATNAPLDAGPTLHDRIVATGLPMHKRAAFGASLLAETDWDAVIAQATGAPVAFETGRLHIEPTRALTVIDVDGWGPLPELVCHAATAAGQAIRRLGIGGQIVIDFPGVHAPARAAAAAAFDAALPKPFERTAINGFGLMQIVRPRVRPSLIEHIRLDPVGHHARLMLEGARVLPPGARTLVVAAAVADWLARRNDLIGALSRHLGGTITLRADAALPNWRWHAERA